MADDDQYRQKTDSIRSKLVDGTLKRMGTEAWQLRFGLHPDIARSSREHIPTRLFIEMGLVYCNDAVLGPSITKTFIDALKDVRQARVKEIMRHRQGSDHTADMIESTRRHEHFNNVILKDLLRMLVVAEQRWRPSSGKSHKNNDESASQLTGILKALEIVGGSENSSSSDRETVRSFESAKSNGHHEQIKSYLTEQGHEEEITQGEVDGNNVDAYCDGNVAITGAFYKVWNKAMRGELTTLSATMAGNLAINMVEMEAEMWETIIENQSPDSKKLFTEMNVRYEHEKDARKSGSRSTRKSRSMRNFQLATKYSVPIVSTLMEYESNTVSHLYGSNLQGSSDLTRHRDDLLLGDTTLHWDPSSDLLVENYSFHFKGGNTTTFVREFSRLHKVEASTRSSWFPVYDRLTASMNKAIAKNKFAAHDPVALGLLIVADKACTVYRRSPPG